MCSKMRDSSCFVPFFFLHYSVRHDAENQGTYVPALWKRAYEIKLEMKTNNLDFIIYEMKVKI